MTINKLNFVGVFLGALLIFLILSPFTSLHAITLSKTTIDKMFQDAAHVAVVQIKGIKSIEFNSKSRIINCGFDYEAQITKGFKGKNIKIKFRSHHDLVENNSYLIFFNSLYQDGNIRFLTMGRNDVALFEKCKGNSPGLYASKFYDEIFELDSIENILSKLVSKKDWVVMKSTRIKVPNHIETKFIDFKGADIPEEYSDYYSHTLILRDDLYRYLETLQAN